ncbi:MAG: DUF6259 domain-containing protein [Acidobacteriota bacterium]
MDRANRREFLKTAGGAGASGLVSALAPRPAKASAPALAVGTAQLENGLVSFEFDEKTGNLRQITDRKTGRRYLNDPRGHRLAKLIVPTPEHISRPLLSNEAGQPAISRHGDLLEIRFPELQHRGEKAGVFLNVRVRLPAGRAEALFSAEIRNDSSHRVHEMWFPWIGGRLNHPGKSRDLVTTSRRLYRDIYAQLAESGAGTHSFGHHHLRRGEDGTHQLPMMDLSDGGGGLSYIKYEQRPSPHILVFENALYIRSEICLTWTWATGVFVAPGQTWTSCEFGVGVHQGDWHDTADRFREWLQGWWKPCDTPPAVREKIGLFHIHTHGFSGERYHEFSELPAIARDAMKFGVRDLMIWDYTASVYYRPDRAGFWEMSRQREEELRRALAELRRLGCSITSYVNWRLAAEYNESWQELKPLVQESLFGVGLFGFPCCTMDGGWYNDFGYEMGSHAVCCGADEFLPYARRVLNRTLDLGFDVISMDQASERNYCLSRRHGHASPWEAWARTYEWYGEATRSTRARNPGSYTLAEIPDLYNTQHIDMWWNWFWRDSAQQNALAPVFRYVLPSMLPCWCIDENQRDVIADAFATGSFMAIATRDMTGLLSDAPELAAQVSRLAKLRKATAPFVSHAQFRDNRGLQVEGGKGYVYVSPRGLAVTLANGLPQPTMLKVLLSPDALGKSLGSTSSLFVEGERPKSVSPQRRGDRLSLSVRLPAYGAGVLTME